MEKVTIEKVIIGSFRNLINQEFDISKILTNRVAFSGSNHIGKTNVLNAIMWCLCGVDLDDAADDRKNIPSTFKLTDESSVVVDVTVTLNVGEIRRFLVNNKGRIEEKLSINGTDCSSLRNGEVQIDSMLGILPLVIKSDAKDFKVRRFLLNPLYIEHVTPKAFRTFILSILNETVSYEQEYSKLSNAEVDQLVKFSKSHDPATILKSINDSMKLIKKDIDGLKFTSSYFEEIEKDGVYVDATLKEKVSNDLTIKNEFKTKTGISQYIAENYLLEINKKYDEVARDIFDGITFCLIEKGVDDDAWKETCYPFIKKNIPFSKGSTSEKILTSCKLVMSVIKYFNQTSTLPVLFDEAETIDHRTSYNLSMSIDAQMVSAKVCEGLDGIQLKSF